MTRRVTRFLPAQPPALAALPLVHASDEVERWLQFYWLKLKLPALQLGYLAVTTDRREFAQWTGRRLNPMALGCYCYLPMPDEGTDVPPLDQHHRLASSLASLRGLADATALASALDATGHHAQARQLGQMSSHANQVGQMALPGFDVGSWVSVAVLDHGAEDIEEPSSFRHLIFVEPDLLPLGIEVTVAHELIHLADRVHGNPRKHHCHGYDSIANDEAAITERDPEELRTLLRQETERREQTLRQLRPYRYLYVCPSCGREYRRVKRYARIVSCGNCDRQYNPAYLLRLHALLDKDGSIKEVLEREA